MSSKYLYGLLTRFVASPLFWLLSLSLLWMSYRRKELTVTKVPGIVSQAVQRALTGSPYQIHLVNWLAVSKMETAGWTSTVYKVTNNLWGMRPSRERSNSQDGIYLSSSNGDFAKYYSLDRAAQDIVLYMKAKNWPTYKMSLYEHVLLMGKHGYYGNESPSKYLQAVEAWAER